jgi:UDP-N-acetylmuramate dehydrogenase
MPVPEETLARLAAIPQLRVSEGPLLSQYTRFGIGGPARMFAETADEAAFIETLSVARASGMPYGVIGGGTNLIVADEGFPGIVLRFTADRIGGSDNLVYADAGASLQALVDHSIERGLAGLHTMTGIPGWVGAAVYGNAGAYGHSISESIRAVRFCDGASVRTFSNAECAFAYRESAFKRRKDWVIFSCELELTSGDSFELRRAADGILTIRNEKYPPTMKCAGSIFKNLLMADLAATVRAVIPERVVREGKVPSAWFLEQVGAKGMRSGDIQVADYHANLIYNAGVGRARELREIIGELKERVRERFGLELEEEVQYVGFGV